MGPYVKTVVLVAVVKVACAMAGNAQLSSQGRGKYYCGYKIDTIKEHKVTSADGYKTTLLRLPHNKLERAEGRPVLLQHSFGYNADSWFRLGKNSLPCLLSEEGYDVWVANARGNSYSREHTTLNRNWIYDLPIYWSFSFHEMAVKDLPKTIDHILQNTTKTNLSYVGHGMGGTMTFILLSEQPKYNAKIKGAVTFAPTCYTSPKNWIVTWFAETLAITMVLEDFGIQNLPVFTRMSGNIDETFIYEALKTFEYVLNMDQSRGRETPIFGPDKMSWKTLVHLCQLLSHGGFQQYDLGLITNKIVYGYWNPPAYNVRKITTPQFIMYSGSEEFIGEKGAKRLCSKLPKNKGKCYRVRSGFRHKDFLSKGLAKQHVYDVAMRELAHYLPPIPTTPPPPENPECLVSK